MIPETKSTANHHSIEKARETFNLTAVEMATIGKILLEEKADNGTITEFERAALERYTKAEESAFP